MAENWSRHEVELIVQDYFEMLHKELSGINYSKTDYRNKLIRQLNNRSEGSIEFKHQNISAILRKYGQLYIQGYKPRHNYQLLLEEIVISYLTGSSIIKNDFQKFVNFVPEIGNVKLNYEELLVKAPKTGNANEDPGEYKSPMIRMPNYLKLEQQNTLLGEKGENLVIDYEKWRLISSGKESLADKIEWISKEQGDGAGFDILSKNLNGKDRYIEVKTTKLGDKVPIYFSRNEFNFAQKKSSDYFLYRVFNFYQDPRFFIKNGSFDTFCRIEPLTYIGRF